MSSPLPLIFSVPIFMDALVFFFWFLDVFLFCCLCEWVCVVFEVLSPWLGVELLFCVFCDLGVWVLWCLSGSAVVAGVLLWVCVFKACELLWLGVFGVCVSLGVGVPIAGVLLSVGVPVLGGAL